MKAAHTVVGRTRDAIRDVRVEDIVLQSEIHNAYY